MEVRNNGNLQFPRFADAQNSANDSVSHSYANPAGPNADTLGLVTRFTYVVPEPQVFALIGLLAVLYHAPRKCPQNYLP
jgi:hypothetical protein